MLTRVFFCQVALIAFAGCTTAERAQLEADAEDACLGTLDDVEGCIDIEAVTLECSRDRAALDDVELRREIDCYQCISANDTRTCVGDTLVDNGSCPCGTNA
jgi:hypothetical protein